MECPCLRNSTNRGTTPHSITRSMGGFFSFERSFRNLAVASSCLSGSSEKTPETISSANWEKRLSKNLEEGSIRNNYRGVPCTTINFFIRVVTSRRKEIAPLRNVFFPLLPSDLNLLLFSTTPEIVLFETAFTFVGFVQKRVKER